MIASLRLALAAITLLAFSTTSSAAETAVGEWDVVSDFNGQQGESKLTIKKDGDSLSGTISSEIGEFELSDVTLSNDELKFATEIDANGQQMTFTFSGKISGDALEGNWSTDFGEFPAEAKRSGGGGDAPGFVGTWNLMVNSQLGNNARKLVVKPDMTGTYGGGDFANFAVSNIKVDGNTAQMDVTISAQGVELPSKIKLTLDGDKVSGTLDYGQGEATITGNRATSATIVGTWKITADSQLGVNERKLIVNPDMTGTYGGGDFEDFALSEIKMDGDTATMKVTIEAQGLELPATIKLKLDGDKVEGTLDFGQGTAKLSGTRQ